ncbi:dolichyl-phosphate-mannose--protein mannosyltransferase [Bogoriella caseilytica]|uniref:Polyprenol-phosphate-mannose--protein mannosyltransferase n=1 Tax=Bogoriella caseilytica TaxID=56055 RepID=A0A3N2BB19_9MICO|nr:phospholipid carrier-dependent glycosyltransferase [Bogoriella caseilytica]ROR72274.1 dolichyl-phosphate-mannose-protein mannosyltransferase [Bogoriella caseilytica]
MTSALPETALSREDTLRARLGLRPAGERLSPTLRLWGWIAPLAIAVLAGVLRFVRLDHPGRLIFDETYYVKQAYSLLSMGYEGRWGGEDDDRADIDARFSAGNTSDLTQRADNVVHPPLGKWLIAVGLRIFGHDNGWGWRFSTALAGTLAVLLLARLALRLFGSIALASTAGLLLALDGVHLTLSRTGLLDVFLSTLVLLGLWCVVRDRETSRATLARHHAQAAAPADQGAVGAEVQRETPTAGAGVRWWLIAAGVALGAACAVKWSGIYAVAVFGVLAYVWDASARRSLGEPRWLLASVWRGGIPAFLALVPTAALTYVAGWASWFLSPGARRRQWAAELREAGEEVPRSWLPDAVNSWWEYHRSTWEFHTGLDSEHTYMSHPLQWLVQHRPVSFYWPDLGPRAQECGAERCVESIVNLGNPVLWWCAAAALPPLVVLATLGRDWRAWAIVAGYAAMFVPWLAYPDRTVFNFYSVAFVPYVVLALTFTLGWLTGLLGPPEHTRGWESPRIGGSGRWRYAPLAAVLALSVAAAVFFWPIWTGEPMAYEAWQWRMWLPSWI